MDSIINTIGEGQPSEVAMATGRRPERVLVVGEHAPVPSYMSARMRWGGYKIDWSQFKGDMA